MSVVELVNRCKNRVFSLLFCVCALYGTGCSTIEFKPVLVTWEARLQYWLDQSEYAKAEDWLRVNGESGAVQLPLMLNGEELSIQSVRKKAATAAVQQIQRAQMYAQEARWWLGIEQLSALERKLPKDFRGELLEQISILEQQFDAYMQQAHVAAAIEYGQWLTQQAKIYRADVEQGGWGSFGARIKWRWNWRLQQRKAKGLLVEASSALSNGDYLVANRIYGTLAEFTLAPEMERHYVQLGYQLLEQVEANLGGWSGNGFKVSGLDGLASEEAETINASPRQGGADKKDTVAVNKRVEKWVVDVEALMREGRLVETQQLLMRLKTLKLTPEQNRKVDDTNQYIEKQIALLDKHADELYRHGLVSDAHSIWALLMQLDEKDANIRLKYYRSEKVLGNMQELRDEGFFKSGSM